jgi:copper resistance protein B
LARITTSWSSSRRVKAKNLEEGQLQVLYSRLISYYFNAQAGTRQDFSKKSNRTYAVLQGLASGFIETDTELYISQRGEVSASFTAFYDLLITNRLKLQPRVDLKLQAQPVPDLDSGSGLTDFELGGAIAL